MNNIYYKYDFVRTLMTRFLKAVKLIKEYRNEWKFCCDEKDLAIIKSRLAGLLTTDSYGDDNGRYEIHSLYFDDLKDTCVRENDAGISERVKYRIRYYGRRPELIRLERKEKRNGRGHKDNYQLSIDEYQKIIKGKSHELFWETQDVLLQEFCIRCMTGDFRPKAVIAYERTAYVEEIANIRITLDENISVSDDFMRFLDGDYMKYPIQEKRIHILEVKFDYVLPNYIKHIITNRHLSQSSFSKYGLGRKKLQDMGRL